MNKVFVELVRKYETKATKMQSKSFIATMYYSDAAKAVLALARQ
jgi:hypothetical protein